MKVERILPSGAVVVVQLPLCLLQSLVVFRVVEKLMDASPHLNQD